MAPVDPWDDLILTPGASGSAIAADGVMRCPSTYFHLLSELHLLVFQASLPFNTSLSLLFSMESALTEIVRETRMRE